MLPIKQSRRIGRFVSIPVTLLLLGSMFMPAARGCEGKPIYPYEFVSKDRWGGALFLTPHLFALLCLVAAILFVRATKQDVSLGAKFYRLATAVCAIPAGLFQVGAVISPGAGRWNYAFLIPGLLIYFGLLYMLWRSRRMSEEAAVVGRAMWVGSGMAANWYLFWILTEQTMYGLWVSFGSSLLLFLCGYFIEHGGDSNK